MKVNKFHLRNRLSIVLLQVFVIEALVSSDTIHAYQWLHCNENPHLCIPRKGIARPQSQFPHSCVCEQWVYSQDRSTYFPVANWQTDCGNIHKSLTDRWILKLGLRPRNYFSGTICFEFSVLCLCSVSLSNKSSIWMNLLQCIMFQGSLSGHAVIYK